MKDFTGEVIHKHHVIPKYTCKITSCNGYKTHIGDHSLNIRKCLAWAVVLIAGGLFFGVFPVIVTGHWWAPLLFAGVLAVGLSCIRLIIWAVDTLSL
jgi:hypothetical protein